MTEIPPITGIVESVLYVDDLPRAIDFYQTVLGLQLMTGDPARFQSFKICGGQVLLLFKRGATLEPMPVPGGVIPPHDGTGPHHIGFAVTTEAYDQWRKQLPDRGVVIESETHWPRGGRSLYLRDPDGHLLELITPGIWPNY